MPLVMTWWTWLLLGLVLAALELATPGGFFILFFGLGAIVVGILELLGLRSRCRCRFSSSSPSRSFRFWPFANRYNGGSRILRRPAW